MRIVVVVVMMVGFMAVTVALWMSVGNFEQPHIFPSLELNQFVRAVAQLLLSSPLHGLRDHRAAVLEAGLRLWASLFWNVDEPCSTGLLMGMLMVLMGQFWWSDTYAFSAVDSAGWENVGNNSSQALSGPWGNNRLWGRIGDVHPSDRLTPKVIRLGCNFSLGL